MKKQREEKGITLVALVVTIIVLIILAGVTLNIVFDNDGIINKTQQAAGKYENAQKKEEELLGQVEDYLEYVNTNPPIPDGYTASQVPGENMVTDGLVIYEGTTPVTEENHEEAMKSRNQYVWIPVTDINSMVMCSSNTGDSVCNLELEGDTLKCTVHTDTATNLVGRLYTTTETSTTEGDDNIYSYTMDFTKRDQIYNPNNGNREPAVVTGNDTGDGTEYDGANNNYHGQEGTNAFLTQLTGNFKKMATSVAKNGGFYVSRYEIGENGDSKKEKEVLTASSSDSSNYLGANMWYGLYNATSDITNNQQMLWGCQHDQIIKFIGEEAQIGHNDRNLTNSSSLSGQNELDKMKNLYDIEGNFKEWTTEALDIDNRVFRGSGLGSTYNGNFFPASYRFYDVPNNAYYIYSARSTLYL